jgi:heme exporter protein A
VEGLAIVRGGRWLFEGMSFAAGPGDFVELRGANGTGKTSLLRAIAGFLHPRVGHIVFERAEEPALALHYLGHLNGLKSGADVHAHLRYWAGLLGGGGDLGAVLTRVGLSAQADLPARALSQGQARRLALSRLLLAPRPIWLLDEAAAALDASGREMLAALIQEHREQGGLILAAVHEPLGPTPSQTITLGAA